jgi:2-dehydro-3-deoxygluconokinase
VNRELVSAVDVLFGNEEDFSATLGVAIEGVADAFSHLPVSSCESMLHRVSEFHPNSSSLQPRCVPHTHRRKMTGARSHYTRERTFTFGSGRWRSWTGVAATHLLRA